MSSKFPTMGEIMQVEERLGMIIDAGSAIDLPPSVAAQLQKLIRELRIPGSDLATVRQAMAEAQNYIEEYPVTPVEVQRFRDTGETGEYRQKTMSRLLELEDYEIDVLEDEWRHIYKSDPVKRLLPPNKRSLYAKKDPLLMSAYKTSLIDSLVRTPRVGDPVFRFEGNKRLKQFIGAADTLYIPVDQAMLKVLLRRVDKSPKDIAYDTVQQMMNLAHGAPSDKVWGIPRDIIWEVGSKLEDDETNRLLRRAIERGASNLVEEDIPTGIFSHKAVEDLKGAIRQIRETPEATKYAKTGSGRGEVVDLATDKYFAIDPGNADLYAASTKEQMEARAKARSPKAVETINNMIEDVIKMGYSDVDAAVVINQNILDYLQHVEKSIDPQARRLMSYSAMLPSELVNRMEELGPERVRRLAQGAKKLGLKIPKSLGAVGLMALLPFLEDEEQAAVGTAAVSGYGLPQLLSTDERARLNRLRAELEAKAKIIGVDPRQAFVGSPDILEEMDFPIDEYRQLLEKEIRSKASGPMAGRNVQDYIALVSGEVPDVPPIPGAGGPPQDDDPPRELTQQERESRAFSQQERERLIAEGVDPDNIPLERRGFGLRLKEAARRLLANLRNERGAIEIPPWLVRGGLEDDWTDVQEMATGPEGRLLEEDVKELKKEFERPTKREFDMADDPLTPSQAAAAKAAARRDATTKALQDMEAEGARNDRLRAEYERQRITKALQDMEAEGAEAQFRKDTTTKALQDMEKAFDPDEAARATRSVKSKKLGATEEYDRPRIFLPRDQEADLLREGIRRRNLPPTPQQQALEEAIRGMQQGTGRWIAGGPDDPPRWWRNQMTRAEEAARRRAQFRLVEGGKKPKPKAKGTKILGPLGYAIDTAFIAHELADIYGDKGAAPDYSDKEKNQRLKDLVIGQVTLGLDPLVKLGDFYREQEQSGQFVNAPPWLRSLYKKYGDAPTVQEALEAELTDKELAGFRQRIEDEEATEKMRMRSKSNRMLGLEDPQLIQDTLRNLGIE